MRAVDAHPLYLFALIELEVVLLAVLGVVAGTGLLSLVLMEIQPFLAIGIVGLAAILDHTRLLGLQACTV